MHGNFEVLTVRLFDHRRQFRDGKVLLGRHLDDIDVMEHILPDRLPCAICPVKQQKLLLKNGVSKRGIEVLNVIKAIGKFRLMVAAVLRSVSW